jgi:type VI secretion system protein ImpJ
MGRSGRVTWSEGMALDPHHFQQWDRYHLALLHARIRSVAPHAWGLTELQVDAEAIANGTFRLVRCAGTTVDGLLFSIPDTDPPPAERRIAEHFAPTAERLAVFLAVPAERPGARNFLLPHAAVQRESRFVVESIVVADETTGQDERDVEVARLNLMLKFGGESLEAYSTLKVAELLRTPAGEFRVDDRFVPPCMTIGASQALQSTTRRVLERLVTKSLSLWNRTRHLPRGQAALSAADVVSLWLQQTVNAFIPVLRQHDTSGKAHPESLHETLSMLAGQLSALPTGLDLHPRALPTYDHENATSAFAALDRAISRMLEEEIEANYTELPLVRRDDLYVARLADAGLLDDAAFYLIAGGVPAGGERTVPDQLRVAAPAAMPGVRGTFSRALPLGWEPRPPTGTPDGPDLHYFRLDKANQFWDDIRTEGSLAIDVPPRLNGLTMRLIAIRQRT